jgi:predicted RNA-binding Zn ribbon-like protein
VDVPDDLRLLERFLNTLDERNFRRRGVDVVGGDTIATAAALRRWLRDHGLGSPRVTAADRDLTHRVRAALRDAVTPANTVSREASAALAAIPVQLEVTPDGTVQLATPTYLTKLLAIAVHRSADGSWRRLRACAAPECRWVFYDDSRNGAGRWCSMSSCGNRTKTARYRSSRVAGS